MLDAWMRKWVDAVGGLFITMARSLRSAPVLSFESKNGGSGRDDKGVCKDFVARFFRLRLSYGGQAILDA